MKCAGQAHVNSNAWDAHVLSGKLGDDGRDEVSSMVDASNRGRGASCDVGCFMNMRNA